MADEQIIYLGPEEELTNVRERLERIPTRRIILVVPTQTQLRSHVTWRLLYARARELNKEVLVISSDRQIRSVVKAIGFKVADSLESPPSSRPRPGSRPGRTSLGGRTSARLRDPHERSLPDQQTATPHVRQPYEPPAMQQEVDENRPRIDNVNKEEGKQLPLESPLPSPTASTNDKQFGPDFDYRIGSPASHRPVIPPYSPPIEDKERNLQLEDYHQSQSIRQAAQQNDGDTTLPLPDNDLSSPHEADGSLTYWRMPTVPLSKQRTSASMDEIADKVSDLANHPDNLGEETLPYVQRSQQIYDVYPPTTRTDNVLSQDNDEKSDPQLKHIRIFISHSSKDNDFGIQLAEDLRRILGDDTAVWYDVKGGLHAGDTWWDKIVEELTVRNVFLLILSPYAMESKWVLREYNMALSEEKIIIPLIYRKCNIRADIKTIQSISFLPPKLYDVSFNELLKTLGLPVSVGAKKALSEPDRPEAALVRQIMPQIEAAFAKKDWLAVIRRADFLIVEVPGAVSSAIYRMYGLALLEKGRLQDAQEALDAALALVSDREQSLMLLRDYTNILISQHQWPKVLSYVNEALRLAPNDPYWLTMQQDTHFKLAPNMSLVASTRSDAGIKRKHKPNEDSLFAAQGERMHNSRLQQFGLFVVADGMGGHANGQDASRLAIQTIVDRLLPRLSGNEALTDEAFTQLLVDGVKEANLAVHQRNIEDRADMGTTMTAALIVDITAYIINVGDSRTYLYRRPEGLKKVTNDHSVVASLVEAGIIKPDDIYTHPKRNQIYRSLGQKPVMDADSFTVPLQRGDKLLLCSDGLSDMVRDPTIEQILSTLPDPSQTSNALIKAALDGGGNDNVSVIVVHINEATQRSGMTGIQILATPDLPQYPPT